MLKKLLVLSACLTISLSASAWGVAHRVIAYIAYHHLTDKTKEKIDNFLDNPMWEYAMWTDQVVSTKAYKHTALWHVASVDENLRECEPLRVRRDLIQYGMDGQAVMRTRECAQNLMQENLSDSVHFVNLCYIIHSVGDMHCPAHIYFKGIDHSIFDYGFFRLMYEGSQVTYHGLWDLAPDRLYKGWSLERYRKHLDRYTSEQIKEITAGDVAEWMHQSGKSCIKIYDWAKPGDNVTLDFLMDHADLVDYQMITASYRLAALLNRIYDR